MCTVCIWPLLNGWTIFFCIPIGIWIRMMVQSKIRNSIHFFVCLVWPVWLVAFSSIDRNEVKTMWPFRKNRLYFYLINLYTQFICHQPKTDNQLYICVISFPATATTTTKIPQNRQKMVFWFHNVNVKH